MTRRIGFNDAAKRPAGRSGGRGARWLVIGFMLIWLACWSAGIAVALWGFMDAGDQNLPLSAFLAVWLLFAIGAWIFVVRMILRLFRGQDLPKAEPD